MKTVEYASLPDGRSVVRMGKELLHLPVAVFDFTGEPFDPDTAMADYRKVAVAFEGE